MYRWCWIHYSFPSTVPSCRRQSIPNPIPIQFCTEKSNGMYESPDCWSLFYHLKRIYFIQLEDFLMNFLFAASGVWAEWGEWSECDPSSSNCQKFRFRNCNKALSSDACDGNPTETAPCPSESPNQSFCQNATIPGCLLVKYTSPLKGFGGSHEISPKHR